MLLIFVLLNAPAAWALEPSEILLVVNGNAQTGRDLARFYAEKRNVPLENIVTLDLRAQEEISQEDYGKLVAGPVRQFLEKNDPEHRIKCLLTFIGVPIRIANRPITPEQKEELATIRAELKLVEQRIVPLVEDLEALTRKIDLNYKPPTDLKILAALTIRADRSLGHLLTRLNMIPDSVVRRFVLEAMFKDIDLLTGPSGRVQRVMFKDLPLPAPTTQPATVPAESAGATTEPATEPATEPTTVPTTESADNQPNIPPDRRAMLLEAQRRISKVANEMAELANRQDNPAAREQIRVLSRDELGLLAYGRVLSQQVDLLTSEETGAAVDSELSLVLWGDDYPLYRWIDNPLYFRNAARLANFPPVMMVMRLDAPQEGQVSQLITASVAAEEKGLGGKVVIDSRGLPEKNGDGAPDAYGEYDQSLRNLAKLLKEKTQLPVVFDDQHAVLRAGSVKDVGVYAGWYAVRNYIPSCSFRPGAVGYHVASLEMISLKSAGERGWVAGQLNDGIAATLGAVAEPYLHSFPKADEFFPLLFTGKLTLAEVYWRTNPLVSWQISMIGDPLYTPFKHNPALKLQDLPPGLGAVLRTQRRVPATLPATRPVQ